MKFGSSATKGVCTNRIGSAGAAPPCHRDVTDPRDIRSSTVCYPAEFGRSRSKGSSVIKEIHLRNLISRVPSFKVTQGHRN